MHKPTTRLFPLALLIVLSAMTLQAQFRVVGKFGRGQVGGRNVVVHVSVAVPPGANANQVAADAIRRHGGHPLEGLESADFTTTGLVWDEFSDSSDLNDFVLQNYNPASDPTGLGLTELTATHSTWRAVDTSRFDFAYGGTTDRCPSLVDECPGDQTFDGWNDVGWLDLGRIHRFFGGTLGVTWYSTETDEADMALNTRVNWTVSGGGSGIDVQTVFLHENGHVAGLGHSTIQQAIMYASYQSVRRVLHPDDIDGITALYPGESSCTKTENPEVSCSDGIDNDCNGFIDDGDLNCEPACTITETPETSCSDGTDNDCDGLVDGDDDDCSPGCTVTEPTEVTCDDFQDNDCDGVFDLDDPDCDGSGSCTAVGGTCSVDSDCCSSKCRGRRGGKTCKA